MQKSILQIVDQVQVIVDRMKDSRNIADSKEVLKVSSSLSLEINCIRWKNDFDDDECRNSKDEQDAIALQFEIYAIKKGKAIDQVTIDVWNDITDDVSYLLRCYTDLD